MLSLLKKISKKILVSTIFRHIRASYSQSGEDIIISNLFARLGIKNPSYLDIGANEPVAVSNTYRLYFRGSKGVCIEPSPVMYNKLKKKRPRDICINAGVAFDEKQEADFYIFPEKLHGLNTFSKEDADFWEQTGTKEIGTHKVQQVIKMPLIPINDLIGKHFHPHPNFISIDTEGLDLPIAMTIDFDKYKPEVFCVETLGFTKGGKEIKKDNLISFFESKGYFVYADTYVNTILCLREAYKDLA